MNVSGAAVARYAPNKKNALRLLEFLVSSEGQKIYANKNNEYPVSEDVVRSELLQSWGGFRQDNLSLVEIAGKRVQALMIADRVGYNN